MFSKLIKVIFVGRVKVLSGYVQPIVVSERMILASHRKSLKCKYLLLNVN